MTFVIEPQQHKREKVMRYFRVDRDTNEQLTRIANDNGVPVSDLIARCIEFAINNIEVKNGVSDKGNGRVKGRK